MPFQPPSHGSVVEVVFEVHVHASLPPVASLRPVSNVPANQPVHRDSMSLALVAAVTQEPNTVSVPVISPTKPATHTQSDAASDPTGLEELPGQSVHTAVAGDELLLNLPASHELQYGVAASSLVVPGEQPQEADAAVFQQATKAAKKRLIESLLGGRS